MPSPIRHDVIIAGAGPVGLMLACELRLANLSVLVLEKAPDSHSQLKRPPFGTRGLSIPTVEALHRRGLLDALMASSHSGKPAAPSHALQQVRQPGGHFAGIPFSNDKVDATHWSYRLCGPAAAPLASTMESIEAVLNARAVALGADVRFGWPVDDLTQSHDGVTVHANGGLFHGRWLVGCDGGRSTVRKAAGFDFVGTDPEFTGYSVDVEWAEGTAPPPGRLYTATGMYTFQPPGIVAMVDFDGGAFHRSGAITAEHVQGVLRRITGTQATVKTVRLATTWTDRARQANAYRRGRVLLAGDAAHIHSPLGGQGLNLGIGDATNLGWKLAATIRGDAPDGLLDSYFAERHPVGAQVLGWSRAQVALMRPTAATRALADIVRDLIHTSDGATYFAERIWGIALRHDLGGAHPLVGRSAPDFALGDGTTLAEHLRTGHAVLLDFDSDAPLRELARRWGNRLTYVPGSTVEMFGLRALFVRPDGVVAWIRGHELPAVDFTQIATKWLGKPLAEQIA